MHFLINKFDISLVQLDLENLYTQDTQIITSHNLKHT